MKNLCLLFLLCCSTTFFAQIGNFSAAEPFMDECNPFFLSFEAGNTNGWIPTHGAVALGPPVQPRPIFRSQHGIGIAPAKTEGIYRSFPFQAGITYQLNIITLTLQGAPGVVIFLANGMTPSTEAGCGPTTSWQDLGFDNSMTLHPINGSVTFTPTMDFDELVITSSAGDEPTNNRFELFSLELIELGPCPPIPTTRINNSSSNILNICYGDDIQFQGGTAEGSCGYDGFLIGVVQYENGSYSGDMATHYFGPGDVIPTNLNLYDFVQQYSDYWDFEGGEKYRVKLATWTDTNGHPDPDTWRETAQYLQFEEATAHAEFLTADDINIEYSEQGWAAEVADICTDRILVDFSESDCYDRFKITVEKFDTYNWESLPESQSTPWIITSQGPNTFNLSSFDLNLMEFEFDYYDTYRVYIATAFPYTSKSLFFRRLPISDAEINGEFEKYLSEETILNPDKEDVTLTTICKKNGAYTFNAEDSDCVSKHRIRIEKFNTQTWSGSNNPNTYYDSQWQAGSVPDQLSLEDLYPTDFVYGNIYRLHIQVQEPYAEKSYLFQIPDKFLKCITNGDGDPDRKPLGRLAQAEIKLYPNPTHSGIANLQLSNSINPINAEVNIFRSNGQQVRSKIVQQQSEMNIDLSQEPAGLYFIQVKMNDDLRIIKLIKSE